MSHTTKLHIEHFKTQQKGHHLDFVAAQALPVVITLVFYCFSGGSASSLGAQETHKAGELYHQAVQLRTKPGVSTSELQQAAQLLATASGLHSASGSSKHTAPHGLALQQFQRSQPDQYEAITGFPDLLISQHGHAPAIRELGKMLQEGVGVPQNYKLATELFRRAAALGDAEAQGQMGLRYALGLQDSACWEAHGIAHFGQVDEEQALLHYYFAAMGGDVLGRLALAYRHLYGIGVPSNCWTAATYYQPVAEEVTDLATQAGTLPQVEKIRLHLQSSQGHKADRHREVIQYYQYSADRGNVDAQTAVGQVLILGTHGMQRDYAQAIHYFRKAAAAGDIDAKAHLGHLYMNGLGVEKDPKEALKLFREAAKENNAHALFGLGYMHFAGLGATQDYEKAFSYFQKAAQGGHPDAYFFMGVAHAKGLGVRKKTVQHALSYFTMASHSGHIHATYNAAMMHLKGRGTPRSCKPAIQLLKQLSEKGPAGAVLQYAHEQFFKANYQNALWSYLTAAEMGFEQGQSNAAWMLVKGYAKSGEGVSQMAVHMYKRSAEQGNTNSLLMLGDSYFYGTGAEQDWVRSAALYYDAYQERSPEAMFNLGFYHEFGIGVPKDLDLARRFYDMAKHTNPEAFLPVNLAKAWLALHAGWETLRPYLPSQYDHVWNKLFSLEPPHTGLFGSWTHQVQTMLPNNFLMHVEVLCGQWLNAAGWNSLTTDVGDVSETGVLLVLVGVLFYVLRVRRQRAANRAQVPGQAADRQFNAGEQLPEPIDFRRGLPE